MNFLVTQGRFIWLKTCSEQRELEMIYTFGDSLYARTIGSWRRQIWANQNRPWKVARELPCRQQHDIFKNNEGSVYKLEIFRDKIKVYTIHQLEGFKPSGEDDTHENAVERYIFLFTHVDAWNISGIYSLDRNYIAQRMSSKRLCGLWGRMLHLSLKEISRKIGVFVGYLLWIKWYVTEWEELCEKLFTEINDCANQSKSLQSFAKAWR